ncbi:MAG: sigma-70 family RNA polymerase sigma factor [Ruminococcus sp.]|nr:sigma-70 family RNA polymerase sigma factor [Ruminococcus sp.]
MTDRELLDLFGSDIQSAMSAAVDIYSPLVYTIVYSKLGSMCPKEDVEETVSDIFVLLYRNYGKIDLKKGSLKAYLSVIAKRAAMRKGEQLASRETPTDISELADMLSDNIDTLKVREERQELLNNIKKLGKPDCDIILLKYFYGLKSREIAAKLGLKTNTVDKKISRSLEKLKNMLEEEF